LSRSPAIDYLMQPTTFVTVAHEIDYELLKIQARSFDIYADPSIITRAPDYVRSSASGSLLKYTKHCPSDLA
jgi:hypothetical protein